MTKKAFFVGFFCFFSLFSAFCFTQQKIIPDSSKIRKVIFESWIERNFEELREKPAEVFANESGDLFQVRIEDNGDEYAIIVAPEKIAEIEVHTSRGIQLVETSIFTKDSLGTWILTKSKKNNAYLRVSYYFQDNPFVYIQFRPKKHKAVVDMVVFDAYLSKGVPVAVSFEDILFLDYETVYSMTSFFVPWDSVTPKHGLYTPLLQMVGEIRDNLPRVFYRDDVAYNENDVLYFISKNQEVVPIDREYKYLSSAGFVKWIIDGLVYPVNGSQLKIMPLLNPTVEFSQGSKKFVATQNSNLTFSLDWARNLACAFQSAKIKKTIFYKDSGVDVRINPFCSSNILDINKKYFSYSENTGYKAEILKPLLFVLAATEPARFFIGSIKEINSKEEGLGSFKKNVLFFPYFDTQENFYVTVFQDGKEIPLEEFILQNKDNFIHLVRVSASENFNLK